MSGIEQAERLLRESRERLVRCGALTPDALANDASPTSGGDTVEDILALLAGELEQRDAAIEALSLDKSRLQMAQQSADMANTAKSKFVANMSHELRTPLNAIIGYGEILIEGLQDAGMAAEVKDGERIVSAGRHLLKLVDQVLAFSELDTGEMEIIPPRISVRSLLSSILEANQLATMKSGNTLLFEIAPDAEYCLTDERMLKSCIQAVIENAIKFTQGGEIRIDCTRQQSVGAAMVHFTVRDSGIGMSPTQREALFRPFVSTDEEVTTRYGGIGLGLSIARKCAEMLGGDISVSSVLGEGSVFTVSVAQTFGVVETAALDPALIASIGPDYVLLIDDDENAEKTRKLLESEFGSRAALVKGGGDALAIARLQRPALVLLDVKVGGSAGWSVLETFCSDPDFAGIPVIVTTADEDRSRSLRLGAALHLTKPLDRRALIAGSRRLLARRAG